MQRVNRAYFAGLDLGQSQDHTALAIVERVERAGRRDPLLFAWEKQVECRLRYLERMPLGMPYLAMAERIGEVMRSQGLEEKKWLAVDRTGVGAAVVETLEKAGLPCVLWPVTIVPGATERAVEGHYHVPKKDLMARLQIMLENGDLQIAAQMAEAKTLLREMAGMQVRLTPSGNEQVGNWRVGEHDDLVLAVALACWAAKKAYPDPRPGVKVYWTWAGEVKV